MEQVIPPDCVCGCVQFTGTLPEGVGGGFYLFIREWGWRDIICRRCRRLARVVLQCVRNLADNCRVFVNWIEIESLKYLADHEHGHAHNHGRRGGEQDLETFRHICNLKSKS